MSQTPLYITYVKKVFVQNVHSFFGHFETTVASQTSQLESEFDALSIYVSNISFRRKVSESMRAFFEGLKMMFVQRKIWIFHNS